MENVTKDEVRAALGVLMAVSETIRDLGEVPSGVLYSQLMGAVSLSAYEKIIGTLKGAKLVEETPGHLLRWVGPKIPG
jgi:hypothetical protein